jgi:hypothetical protein
MGLSVRLSFLHPFAVVLSTLFSSTAFVRSLHRKICRRRTRPHRILNLLGRRNCRLVQVLVRCLFPIFSSTFPPFPFKPAITNLRPPFLHSMITPKFSSSCIRNLSLSGHCLRSFLPFSTMSRCFSAFLRRILLSESVEDSPYSFPQCNSPR